MSMFVVLMKGMWASLCSHIKTNAYYGFLNKQKSEAFLLKKNYVSKKCAFELTLLDDTKYRHYNEIVKVFEVSRIIWFIH